MDSGFLHNHFGAIGESFGIEVGKIVLFFTFSWMILKCVLICKIVFADLWSCFSSLLDCRYKSSVPSPNIQQHYVLEIHLRKLLSVLGSISQKANYFAESGLVAAKIFMHILQIGELLYNDFVNETWFTC